MNARINFSGILGIALNKTSIKYSVKASLFLQLERLPSFTPSSLQVLFIPSLKTALVEISTNVDVMGGELSPRNQRKLKEASDGEAAVMMSTLE
jgi:hypothetical protein